MSLAIGPDYLDLVEQHYAFQAQESFWAYRRFMDPNLVVDWWPYDLSMELQSFYEKLIARKRPKLAIMAPPQHGKSRAIQDFLAWVAGKNPEMKQMFASYSNDLGVDTNRVLQRTFDDRKYRITFPRTMINSRNVVTDSRDYRRNSALIEFVRQRGSFRNITVGGQATGKGLDLGVVDDPVKGRAEVSSKTMRDKIWSWFLDDWFSRFSDHAGLIFIMTRWHVDDPLGRFLETFPDVTVLRYPALAEEDSEFRKKGQPLFPKFKSLEFLMERKNSYTSASWESLYQQNPIVVGGDLFPADKVRVEQTPPSPSRIRRSVRYWDKAGSHDSGAFTSGVLMHSLDDGSLFVDDVVRGQWSYNERENRIKNTAEMDKQNYSGVQIWVEQEPGSGGKESAERTIQMLRGFPVFADPVRGSKELRSEPWAAQWQGGGVAMRAARWNRAYVTEHEEFPSGKYKDQVDSSSGACAKLASQKYNYDTSLRWVRGR